MNVKLFRPVVERPQDKERESFIHLTFTEVGYRPGSKRDGERLDTVPALKELTPGKYVPEPHNCL